MTQKLRVRNLVVYGDEQWRTQEFYSGGGFFKFS
jgi:hypothetical protein